MIPVSVVWFRGDEKSLETHLPLQWGGQRIMGLDNKNGLHLVFLEGLPMLSSGAPHVPHYRGATGFRHMRKSCWPL